jgi:hypothetical protein
VRQLNLLQLRLMWHEEIYIVSIWSNRQNRNSLHSALREDAQSLYFEE